MHGFDFPPPPDEPVPPVPVVPRDIKAKRTVPSPRKAPTVRSGKGSIFGKASIPSVYWVGDDPTPGSSGNNNEEYTFYREGTPPPTEKGASAAAAARMRGLSLYDEERRARAEMRRRVGRRCGMRVGVFWLLVGLGVFVVVGVAVGVGVGLRDTYADVQHVQRRHSNPPREPDVHDVAHNRQQRTPNDPRNLDADVFLVIILNYLIVVVISDGNISRLLAYDEYADPMDPVTVGFAQASVTEPEKARYEATSAGTVGASVMRGRTAVATELQDARSRRW
ncbi:hypothetical protein CMUS01_15355 [Colletotrichum musicola]|uniref:Transmembrane protein n=1 Tax=Colletotrichum musicola TaxID=2175873 RepID=A0A8H6MNG2_9PEZI|nr:hypothetical protein CMUS01_15355 [Colletotrichum musicola]